MHPVLFVVGRTTLYAYGTAMTLAVAAVVVLLSSLARREGVPVGALLGAYGAALVGGIVGARLLYALVNLQELDSLASVGTRGGFLGYGGFLGALAGASLVLRGGKIRLLAAADLAAPCFAAWMAIMRLGSYLFGSDFGVPLPAGAPAWLAKLGTFPHWAPGTLAYGEGAPAWAAHVHDRGLSRAAAFSLPVHPTQLYDMLAAALLFYACLAVRPYQRFRGQLFLAFLVAYGAWRFAFDLLLDDAARGTVGPAFAEHRVIPAGLALFGVAYAVRMAPVVENVAVRRITQAAAFVPALVALVVLWPASFVETRGVALSVTQWAALFTGVAAGVVFARLHRAAVADPVGAMAVRTAKKKRRRKG